MSSDVPENIKVKSLYKAVKLLDFFTTQRQERGVSELAELSGMMKSSVSNILGTYEACGIVAKNPQTGKYHLGLKILELSNTLSQDSSYWQIIRPKMDMLTALTGESTFMGTPYGTQMIYRDAVWPAQGISIRSLRGVVAPMHCTGIGKAMLAFLGDEMLERIIQEGLPAYTENTITNPNEFRLEISKIRKQGYSFDNMEHEYGIKCVGAPIFNSGGGLVGGLCLSGPSLRFDEKKVEEYAVMLRQTCADLRYNL